MMAGKIPGGFRTVPNRLVEDTGVSDGAVRLWCWLHNYSHHAEGVARPSRKTLAGHLAVSQATVDRRIDELVDAGWITPLYRVPGRNGCIAYSVHTEPSGSRQRLAVTDNGRHFTSDRQPETRGKRGNAVRNDDKSRLRTKRNVVKSAREASAVIYDGEGNTPRYDPADDRPLAGAAVVRRDCDGCGGDPDFIGLCRACGRDTEARALQSNRTEASEAVAS